MDKHFDPFKAALAERIESMQKVLHGVEAQSELIRERVFRPEKHLVPKLNTLYDSQRTPNAWRYTADASVPFTAAAIGTTGVTLIPVTLPVSQNLWRLEQWPNAVSLYLVIIDFQFATTATANSAMLVAFQPKAGPNVFLGAFNTNFNNFSFSGDILLPIPISDPGDPNLGNIAFFPGSGAIALSVSGFITLAAAYLLPSSYAYELRSDVAQPVEQHKGNGHIIVEGNY